MICERCLRLVIDPEEHGLYLCPLEPRRANAVIPDDIPGGVVIEHGICNDDGSPRTYYSRSEMKRACAVKEMRPWSEYHSEDHPRIREASQRAEWAAKAGDAARLSRDTKERERETRRR